MISKVYDVFIIGAGPAGLTAAIYASRANYLTAIIDKDAPGGKVTKTAEIENWTGFKKVTGPDLAYDMYEHALAFGAKHLYGEVVEVKLHDDLKEIILSDGKVYQAKSIIVASGTIERKMGIPGEQELYGSLISYCAVCDGAFHKDKPVIVVGGGNSALEESLYLSRFASIVYIVYRRDKFFRAEARTIDKVHLEPKIKAIFNAKPLACYKSKNGITLKYQQNSQEKTLEGSCLFPLIGADPESNFIKDRSFLTKDGYFQVNESTTTKNKGFFVAGDVRVKKLRQIATAVGDGAVAAQAAIDYLDTLQ